MVSGGSCSVSGSRQSDWVQSVDMKASISHELAVRPTARSSSKDLKAAD